MVQLDANPLEVVYYITKKYGTKVSCDKILDKLADFELFTFQDVRNAIANNTWKTVEAQLPLGVQNALVHKAKAQEAILSQKKKAKDDRTRGLGSEEKAKVKLMEKGVRCPSKFWLLLRLKTNVSSHANESGLTNALSAINKWSASAASTTPQGFSGPTLAGKDFLAVMSKQGVYRCQLGPKDKPANNSKKSVPNAWTVSDTKWRLFSYKKDPRTKQSLALKVTVATGAKERLEAVHRLQEAAAEKLTKEKQEANSSFWKWITAKAKSLVSSQPPTLSSLPKASNPNDLVLEVSIENEEQLGLQEIGFDTAANAEWISQKLVDNLGLLPLLSAPGQAKPELNKKISDIVAAKNEKAKEKVDKVRDLLDSSLSFVSFLVPDEGQAYNKLVEFTSTTRGLFLAGSSVLFIVFIVITCIIFPPLILFWLIVLLVAAI